MQAPTSLKYVTEATTQIEYFDEETQELNTETKEPTFLKLVVEAALETEDDETYEASTQIVVTKTYEATIQTEATTTTETQESSTKTETVETQEPTIHKEGVESLKSVTDEDKKELERELSLLKLEVSKWKYHANQYDKGIIYLAEHKNTIHELREKWCEEILFQ